MILFLFSLFIVILNIVFGKSNKINEILVVLAFLFVCFTYTILAANSTNSQFFIPQKKLQLYPFTGNYYNWLTSNLINLKLYLNVDENHVNYLTNGIDKNLLLSNKVDNSIKMFYDTSIYKNKVYLYFGITPIFLFYLPFYLATGYFISDHLVVLSLSLLIFLLQILIYEKILKLLSKKDTLTVIPVIIFGLCSGITLTYISITVHLIPILSSIFCSLISLYLFLLLFDRKYINVKMFLIGLFLALAVGARPSSIILLMLIFVLLLYNFNIKKYWRQYLYFSIPIIFYGTILAVYNYLRFDSIFDFGYTYQFSPLYQKGVAQNLNHSFADFIKHIFLNLFHLPIFASVNPFCVFKNYETVSYFEPMIGGVVVCPIIIFLIFIKNFIMKIFNKNKVVCLLFIVMLSISVVYFLVNSYIGSNSRFVCEYLFLLLIPSLISYYFFIENINNIKIKNILKILFFILVIFSLYINTNLINCIFLMSENGLI